MLNKYRKKWVALFLVLLMGLSVALTGCGKVEDDPEAIYISIQNAGYGYKWIESAANLYTERTGIKTSVDPVAVAGQVSKQMASSKNNNYDMYFNIAEGGDYCGNMAKGSLYVSGYDYGFVDITDIFESEPEGFGGEKVKNLITPFAYRSSTYKDKQYAFNWGAATEGLVYNTKLFEDNGIRLPRTTTELLAVCAQIKALNLQSGGETVYAFNWSQSYWNSLTTMWWFQYEGKQAYELFCEGKHSDGTYSDEIFRQKGKLSAYEIIGNIVSAANAYSNPECTSYSFTRSQISFLEGKAFMMPNGDWLEREAESNFDKGEINIALMKTPINSEIVKQLETINTEKELLEVIDYLDAGKTTSLSKAYDIADIEFVENARNISYSQANLHMGHIPTYSNNIDGAKAFLKFLYAKEVQELIMRESYGNCFVDYDFSNEPIYAQMSDYKKSMDAVTKKENVFIVGKESYAPIYYLGGMPHELGNQEYMAIDEGSISYRNAAKIVNGYYTTWGPKLTNMMQAAGVSN